VRLQRLTGIALSRCQVCGEGQMHRTALVGRLPPLRDTVAMTPFAHPA
jgi:hypothetical protein